MNKKFPTSFQIRTGVQDSAAGFQKQLAFIRNLNIHNTLIFNPLLNHIRKMMNIDHCPIHT